MKSWLLTWNPSRWPWKDREDDRTKTIGGEKAERSWSCHSTKPRRGDQVFLVRLGASPKGIVAAGKVTQESHEDRHWDIALADGGKTTRFIGVAFDSVRDAELDEIVCLEVLQRHTRNQNWSPQSSGIEIKAEAAWMLEILWKSLPPVAQPLNHI